MIMAWIYAAVIACLVFCCFSFLYFRSYIKRKTSYDGVLKEVRDEVNRLLKSIDDITDRDITLIEDREKRLKELLEEIDRRLLALNRELDRRVNAEKTYREMGSLRISQRIFPQNFMPESQQDSSQVSKIPVYKTARTGIREAAPESSVVMEPQPTEPRSNEPVPVELTPPIPTPVPVEEQIRELARAGLTPAIIASRLGISVSEAELAVAIESRRNL